ncbi:DUF2283 domain-containing protein [Deinococcus cellulosilyticus]|uniref:Uncharacterized protein n=1 Tax=Deinococcus cellulosilyticus (strain DSM 18568 / NBRC 106333 / KACC 11606 / 5516J-15) TaxID=1223518 RepID=A0A511N8M4_DEIC1|nr:DUF2283 domain-containing protein [Deinococcus cellulosilyticus]GEM49180.1 hypothetical protein DC3_48150 [Deinococcus cellulosilyticus NBRC 106333 = KACC 11606]
MNLPMLEIRFDAVADTLYVKLRRLKVYSTFQHGSHVVNVARNRKVVDIEILHFQAHLQRHGKITIPPRFLTDGPVVPMDPAKKARLRKAIVESSGIINDEEAEEWLALISQWRGRPFTAPNGNPGETDHENDPPVE